MGPCSHPDQPVRVRHLQRQADWLEPAGQAGSDDPGVLRRLVARRLHRVAADDLRRCGRHLREDHEGVSRARHRVPPLHDCLRRRHDEAPRRRLLRRGHPARPGAGDGEGATRLPPLSARDDEAAGPVREPLGHVQHAAGDPRERARPAVPRQAADPRRPQRQGHLDRGVRADRGGVGGGVERRVCGGARGDLRACAAAPGARQARLREGGPCATRARVRRPLCQGRARAQGEPHARRDVRLRHGRSGAPGALQEADGQAR
mmetsp:Transcript_20445/g.54191  ORF Transcript_20445/g.54191 Transcript_20445/m.54191 type:complete len:261 (+) Transcript_20445:596-1378(+)